MTILKWKKINLYYIIHIANHYIHMAKSTTEELQKELEDVVAKHNQDLELMGQCKTRAIEITAVLKDRAADEEIIQKENLSPE